MEELKLTPYELTCGYVQRAKFPFKNGEIMIELYMEFSHFHVKIIVFDNEGNYIKTKNWKTFEKLTPARKAYAFQKRMIKRFIKINNLK